MEIGGIMGLAEALIETYRAVSISLTELNGQVLNSEEEIPGFVTKLVNLVQKRDFFFNQGKRQVCVCVLQPIEAVFFPLCGLL